MEVYGDAVCGCSKKYLTFKIKMLISNKIKNIIRQKTPTSILKAYYKARNIWLYRQNKYLNSLYFSKAVNDLRMLEEEIHEKEEDGFNVPFKFRGVGFYRAISPSQVEVEIRSLYDLVKEMQPSYVCEIGTDKGGTFYLWCQTATDDALLISLDLPSRGNYCPERLQLYSLFRKCKSQQIKFLPCNSHLQQSLDSVQLKLNGNKLDFLFIDGDHTYEGVKKDYEMYSPLVRKGGIIAFHDIRTVREDCGVMQFWRELCEEIEETRRCEFAVQDFGPLGAGIGVVFK
jgi:predicted O-methyltransferase YrrM